MDSVDLLEVGQYDQIKKIVDEAMKAGSDRDLGHVYIEGIEERLTKLEGNYIITCSRSRFGDAHEVHD